MPLDHGDSVSSVVLMAFNTIVLKLVTVKVSRARAGFALAFLLVILLLAAPARGDTTSSQQTVHLYTGGTLKVDSNQNSIQKIVVQGNITAAKISNQTIPARTFSLSTNTTQFYTVMVFFSLPGSYTATITLNNPAGQGNSTQIPSFYVSGGSLNLTMFANFDQAPPGQPPGAIGWSSFTGWVLQFGGAFPLWVKLVYLALSVQFGFVGYRWIKFEDERRRLEKHLPPIDRGNKLYLWTDIIFRALLTGFVLCIIVMIGEAVVILVAQNLFFVNLTIVSLLDFFSLFFVAILALIVYITREMMDRFLDLKPLLDD